MQENNRRDRALRCCDLIFLRLLPTAFLLMTTIRIVMAWIGFSDTAGAFSLIQLYSDTFPMICFFVGLSSVADFFERLRKAAAVFRYLAAGLVLLHVVLAFVNLFLYITRIASVINIEPFLCTIACIPIAISCVLGDKHRKAGTTFGLIATLLVLITSAVFPLGSSIANGVVSTEYITALLRYVLNTLIIAYCFTAAVFAGLVRRSR